eukprot:gb/GFBE01051638.1/.p1 GENE.gb/GFBE01051638.1/~~gb/GFBE01051638.1/.p1  ORF type:complete len:318 (+),score=71.58 gb/GFBE01051638.1/:1-954(+)
MSPKVSSALAASFGDVSEQADAPHSHSEFVLQPSLPNSGLPLGRRARLAAGFLDVGHSAARSPSSPSSFLFGLFKKPAFFEDPKQWSPFTWRKQHNYFLDRGMKFMIHYRTPQITGTNLFDQEQFGCVTQRGPIKGEGLEGLATKLSAKVGIHQEKEYKKWWLHPRIEFAAPYKRIGVRLQDLTTGELRWDAIYNLGDAKWKKEKKMMFEDKDDEDYCFDNDGWTLCPDERPIGGEHPFFQPDWCPGPNDGMAHKYRLTVKNLSQVNQPEQPIVGEIFFTQYPLAQLLNTYDYENYAPVDASLSLQDASDAVIGKFL